MLDNRHLAFHQSVGAAGVCGNAVGVSLFGIGGQYGVGHIDRSRFHIHLLLLQTVGVDAAGAFIKIVERIVVKTLEIKAGHGILGSREFLHQVQHVPGFSCRVRHLAVMMEHLHGFRTDVQGFQKLHGLQVDVEERTAFRGAHKASLPRVLFQRIFHGGHFGGVYGKGNLLIPGVDAGQEIQIRLEHGPVAVPHFIDAAV